jgi:hypothetical protein
MVWDPVAGLALAAATGGAFVREVLTGRYERAPGLMRPGCGAAAEWQQAG